MREAALPAAGYRTPETHLASDGQSIVRVYPEAAPGYKDFSFHRLGVSSEFQEVFAEGFARATGPAGTRRTIESAKNLYAGISVFANLLASDPRPPTKVADLRASHLHELAIRHTRSANSTLISLRVLLRTNLNIPVPFRNALFTPLRSPGPSTPTASYSEAEFRGIQRAARAHVRAAVARLGAGEAELRVWAENGQNAASTENRRRGSVLEHIAAAGDVPRYSSGASMGHSTGRDGTTLFYSLFPTASDVTALVILFQCLTGQNLSTIRNLTHHYSRADGEHDGETAVLITRASKPRRGPFKAEMDLPLTNISQETRVQPPGGERDDYASAFGVYMIAERLCRRARKFAQSGLLLVSHSFHRRETAVPNGLGFRPVAESCMTRWDGWTDADGKPLRVDSRRLRRTFLELHQRPVAHSADTLANTYLFRDAGTLASNQAVIQHVLDSEVERIRSTNLSLVLTDQDVAQAHSEPEGVAQRFGVTREGLASVLAGRLDTVATACVDNHHGPFTASEKACTASFLLCLGCPCARSEPRHIPVQALLRQRIEARREELAPEQWQRKYGPVVEQLDDVLAQQRAEVAVAATRATGEDAVLIEALLDGRLDLR